MGARAATVSLAEALASRAPDGGLLHVRCVVERVNGDEVCLVDASGAALDLAMEPSRVADAQTRIDHDVVASVLLQADGGKRLLQLQSPSEFVLWWYTRGASVEREPGEHELTFRSLQHRPFEGIERTPGVLGGSARVVGTRISVRALERCRRSGWDDQKMLEAFPSLTSADLAHAWAYVAAHSDEIAAEIDEDEAAARDVS
jgi:uncharacterized protein (DUF433 family)